MLSILQIEKKANGAIAFVILQLLICLFFFPQGLIIYKK